jgi:hypothetical protein
MTDSNLPTLDAVVAGLFRASELSSNARTADFRLRRTVPITIFIDGEDGALSDDVVATVLEALESAGYPSVGEWGPFYGSYLSIRFGFGDEPELGGSFIDHLKDLSRDIGVRLKQLYDSKPVQGIVIIVIVGEIGIRIVGEAAVVATFPAAAVPILAIEYLALTTAGLDAIEKARDLFRH